MTKNMVILGSTGSIGTQALEVATELGITVSGLSANENVVLLEKQVRQFKPKVVAVVNREKAKWLQEKIGDTFTKVLTGEEGLCELVALTEADTVLNSLVGVAGLVPTLEAINNRKNIALANKEALVVGGELVMRRACEKKVAILPVDSEHSAIFQCLNGGDSQKFLKKIILTASGGPFFGKTKSELAHIKKESALKHPNWSMGAKITIDSATMMNKGFEIIEAMWLFGVSINEIDVVVHRESIVHSLVELCDGSVMAQLGVPSMKLPIQYALTYPNRAPNSAKTLNLAEVGSLSFFKPDYETFDCINICKEAAALGGVVPAVVNGANEVAVRLFLNDEISFLDIQRLVRSALQNCENHAVNGVEDLLKADKWARNFVEKAVNIV